MSISHRWQVRITFHSHAKLLSFLEPWFYWRRWSECTRPVHFYDILWMLVRCCECTCNSNLFDTDTCHMLYTVSPYPYWMYWRHWMISDCSRHLKSILKSSPSRRNRGATSATSQDAALDSEPRCLTQIGPVPVTQQAIMNDSTIYAVIHVVLEALPLVMNLDTPSYA